MFGIARRTSEIRIGFQLAAEVVLFPGTIGIFPAAFLFGILYQGGSEVTFDMPNITRYMFVAVQGVIILFSGALENLFRPQIESFFVNRLNRQVEA